MLHVIVRQSNLPIALSNNMSAFIFSVSWAVHTKLNIVSLASYE